MSQLISSLSLINLVLQLAKQGEKHHVDYGAIICICKCAKSSNDHFKHEYSDIVICWQLFLIIHTFVWDSKFKIDNQIKALSIPCLIVAWCSVCSLFSYSVLMDRTILWLLWLHAGIMARTFFCLLYFHDGLPVRTFLCSFACFNHMPALQPEHSFACLAHMFSP